MRFIRQCLKGFPHPGEGQMMSQLLGSDKQRVEQTPGTFWNVELSALQSLRIPLGS